MIKCSKCEINYVKREGDLCELCAKEKGKTARNRKISNVELNGEDFADDFEGYALYLAKRGYGIFTPSGGYSTTLEYYVAVKKIAAFEHMTYRELVENVSELTKEYAYDGPKKNLGDIGHNTWRSALSRFREFVEYKKTNTKKNN